MLLSPRGITLKKASGARNAKSEAKSALELKNTTIHLLSFLPLSLFRFFLSLSPPLADLNGWKGGDGMRWHHFCQGRPETGEFPRLKHCVVRPGATNTSNFMLCHDEGHLSHSYGANTKVCHDERTCVAFPLDQHKSCVIMTYFIKATLSMPTRDSTRVSLGFVA